MTLITAENIFTLANIVFTIGTMRLVKKVISNRNRLNDFDIIGSILTSVALILMLTGYSLLSMGGSFLFTLPTFSFWFIVSVYSIRNKSYQEKMK